MTAEVVAQEALDRRKHTRFMMHEGGIALICNETGIAGTILDISFGGIRVKYIDLGEQLDNAADNVVMLCNGKVNTDEIPCRIIWDKKTANRSPLTDMKTREGGVEFHHLPEHLLQQVDQYMTSIL
ncbi:PilZ domain-containing protein [Thermodesulfobacteriota bacterium]